MNAERALLAPLLLLLGTLAGCLASETPSTDSETHFLTSCESSCGDGLTCICGVCSAACDPARDCSDQHPDASCVSLSSFSGDDLCEAAVDAVCELECAADADCASLSSKHRCDDGHCRAPAVSTRSCTYDGKTYAVGDSFPANDGCNSCSCDRDGQVQCTAAFCEPGQGSCRSDGITYPNGASFPAADGCNTCSCNNGSILCTERGCSPQACEYDGQSFMPGMSFPSSDGCNTCSCDEDGLVACTARACVQGCEYDGKPYPPGATFPSSDGCNTCSCTENGLVACTERACLPTTGECTAPFEVGDCDAAIPVYWYNPGTGLCEVQIYGGCGGNDNRYDSFEACDSACGHKAPGTACKVRGVIYPNGTPVPDPFSCNTCTCDNGSVTGCTEIACEQACPPNRIPGVSCAQCGPADGCEVLETGCLPVCGAADQCDNPEYFFCNGTEGFCQSVCG